MTVKVSILEKPDRNWDKRVLENDGSIYQTTTYSEFQEKCLGMETKYLVAKYKSKIVGQLMVNYGPRFAKYLNKRERLFDFFLKHFKVYTFVRGPIIINKKLKKKIYSAFLSYLDANNENCFMAQDISLQIYEDVKIHNLFYKKRFYSDDWGTVIIDVGFPKEVLWKNIGKKRRNLVRKGENHKLVVKEAKKEEDYNKIISVIKEMSKRNKIFSHDEEYYKLFFKIFMTSKRGKTLFVEMNGRVLATTTLYLFGKQVIQTAVAHSDYCIKNKIPATDFLEWNIIKWAHSKKFKTYDFAGIRPKSKAKKDIGLRNYKSRWGGKEIHYPYFSKKYSTIKSVLIFLLMTMRKWLVRI